MTTETTTEPTPPATAAPVYVRLRNHPDYVTVPEAARRLGMSSQYLYVLIHRGRLQTVRDGASTTQYVPIAELVRLTTPVPTRPTAPAHPVPAAPPPFVDDLDERDASRSAA